MEKCGVGRGKKHEFICQVYCSGRNSGSSLIFIHLVLFLVVSWCSLDQWRCYTTILFLFLFFKKAEFVLSKSSRLLMSSHHFRYTRSEHFLTFQIIEDGILPHVCFRDILMSEVMDDNLHWDKDCLMSRSRIWRPKCHQPLWNQGRKKKKVFTSPS